MKHLPTLKAPSLLFAVMITMAGLLLSSHALANSKTDKIYLKNGDRITGEIKELTQGQLRLKTDAIDTIYIKWEDIDYIDSDKWLQVELSDGSRFFGQTPEPEEIDNTLSLSTSRGVIDLKADDIVRMESIKINQSFWDRLDGRIKIGFNFTKASDVAQFNLNTNADYRTRKYLASVSLDTNLTRKSEGTDTRRADLTGTYLRFRPNRFFRFGSVSAQTNEELGIDLRGLVALGLGRYLVQAQRTDLQLALGLAANIERTTSDELIDSQSEASWEGLISAEWRVFKLYSPKSNWRVRAQLYPGLSDTDRNRGNLDVNFSQEFWKDLFWDMSFYYSYDSKPPDSALAKDDYGINTSIGYSF